MANPATSSLVVAAIHQKMTLFMLSSKAKQLFKAFRGIETEETCLIQALYLSQAQSKKSSQSSFRAASARAILAAHST
jgi:hypothetical protein